VLALEGFIFPEPGDLDTSHGLNFTTPVLCGLERCGSDLPYPRQRDLAVSHLVCPPATSWEGPATVVNQDSPSGSTPDDFIEKGGLDLATLRSYAEAKSPAETDELNRECRRIGNATDLTTFMISTAADEGASDAAKAMAFADWNLDGDRRYAGKTWAGTIPGPGGPPIADERYVD
jgi:hypothetical protein